MSVLIKSSLYLVLLLSFQLSFAQSQQKEVTLYWDASFSMQDRNLENDFELLSRYFTENKELLLHLVTFSNEINLKEDFIIKEGNWLALRKELSQTLYDGSASYNLLFKAPLSHEYILVSDGGGYFKDLPKSFRNPVYVINTRASVNNAKLKHFALASGGDF